MITNVLTIAGSDPSGGAGIQADIKAISANRAYAMAVITALTAQNTQGVSAIHLPPPDFVAQQIRTVLKDIDVHAIKIGMIANSAIATAVADALEDVPYIPVVLDPVMIAKGGAALLEPDAIGVLRDRLLPRALVVTPNIPEAADFLGMEKAQSRDQMVRHAKALLASGVKHVLIKGGHLANEDSPDCLVSDTDTVWYESPRHRTNNTHGTGCTLSAAVATHIAQGRSVSDACQLAKIYVSAAIENANRLHVGEGQGPIHHFHALWENT